MNNIFREYDIRGVFNTELNKRSVRLIGYYIGLEIKKHGNYVAVGYDSRMHSTTLFQYLTTGLNLADVIVLDMGLVPTPNNYFANYQHFHKGVTPSGSIMITGSHNPLEYNGFKITIDKKPFFGQDIYKIGDSVLKDLENGVKLKQTPKKIIEIGAKEKYINFLVQEFQGLKDLDKKIVYDVGNGVAGVVLDEVFKQLGLNVKGLFTEPNGVFPNHHPDPTIEENLIDIKKELENGDFDIGFAYDGDADRIAVLTKKNNIKGDILAILLAQEMTNPTVIGEVKCSQVMYDKINKMGGKSVMYKTGHSNLKLKLKELNGDLAAEVSGHIFFNDRYFGYDDAIYTTFRVLELLQNKVNLDSEIKKLPKVYSSDELKIETTEATKFQTIEKLKKLLLNQPADFPEIMEIIDIDGVRIVFENGWGLVRASNTSPFLISRFESPKKRDLKLYQQKVTELIVIAQQ